MLELQKKVSIIGEFLKILQIKLIKLHWHYLKTMKLKYLKTLESKI